MPTYAYKCSKCDSEFEVFHSMSEVLDTCRECGHTGTVKKIVSKSINIKKNNNFLKQKPGGIVKQYIKDVREEVKQEKRRLKTEEYEP
jgi:putative FmdB family regulatory protein